MAGKKLDPTALGRLRKVGKPRGHKKNKYGRYGRGRKN